MSRSPRIRAEPADRNCHLRLGCERRRTAGEAAKLHLLMALPETSFGLSRGRVCVSCAAAGSWRVGHSSLCKPQLYEKIQYMQNTQLDGSLGEGLGHRPGHPDSESCGGAAWLAVPRPSVYASTSGRQGRGLYLQASTCLVPPRRICVASARVYL